MMATAAAAGSSARAEPGLAASASLPSSQRLRHLDGLRALAALYVVAHHAWRTIWPDTAVRAPSGLLALCTGWLAYGHFAVAVFIVVSGFSLMLPLVRAGGVPRLVPARFLRRRATRILPPYYAALALSLGLIVLCIGQPTGTIWDASLPALWPDLLAHLLLLHNFVNPSGVDYPLWSIAVEWQIYLLFPLLVALWQWLGGVRAVALFGLAAYALYGVSGALDYSLLYAQYGALFAMGALAAAIAYSPDAPWALRWRARVPWHRLALATALGVLAICWLGGAAVLAHPRALDGLVGLGTAALLVALAAPGPGVRVAGETWLRRWLGCRPLASVGLFSYSLYLVHAPLLQVIWQYGVHPLGLSDGATFLLLAGGGIPLVIAAAYGFFLICERPFLTGKPALAA